LSSWPRSSVICSLTLASGAAKEAGVYVMCVLLGFGSRSPDVVETRVKAFAALAVGSSC
jgi:hypothetical protein